jgi:Arc/MetJ family transcription regulator
MCKQEVTMATNLAIDDNLILDAKKIGGHKTKKEAVTEALEEYIKRRKQAEVTNLFGKIDYEKGYNYKKGRSRK